MQQKVGVIYKSEVSYPCIDDVIYPNQQFIELPFTYERTVQDNEAYGMIRELFHLLELDHEHYGSSVWNPLQDNLIKPGDTVLIKPNMVLEFNKSGGGTDCLYTHPSFVAAVIPYIWKALSGKGKIIVADAPVQSCDFKRLTEQSGYNRIIEYYLRLGIQIELKDLRGLVSHFENGTIIANLMDSDGIIVDLGMDSEHAKINQSEIRKVRITNYNPDELLQHHNELKHEYLIAKDALCADVILNMPKPKAHRKAGVTIALKNFIGINVRKEYLPHHRVGDISHGGDEYEKNSFLLKISSALLDCGNRKKAKKKYTVAKFLRELAKLCSGTDKKLFSHEIKREGSWHGNDTIWRTIIDVNRIIQYSDKNGVMQDTIQRKILNIADMIVVGEKEGPLLPSPHYCGVLAASRDTVCFDEIITTLLGFNTKHLPLYKHVRDIRKYPLVREEDYGYIVSNNLLWDGNSINELNKQITLNIEPSSGWKGHIEL